LLNFAEILTHFALSVEVVFEVFEFTLDIGDFGEFLVEQSAEVVDLALDVAVRLFVLGLECHLLLDHVHFVVDLHFVFT